MTILNLYPKGTLEYNEQEIISTGTNNNATIPFNEIISIEFNEPTFFKNGMIKIKSTNGKEIQCIFAKKRIGDAKSVYEEILEVKNNTKQSKVENNKDNEDKKDTNEDVITDNPLNCPFCNNKMIIKKESGFLGGKYYECESCEVSFKKIGNENYNLKDFKEKTFLKKHELTTVPYNDWIKIGQGEYTEDEIKEQSELEFKETLDIKCPTCDTQFNKYHKKGILSFDSIICPTCNARYELMTNKYLFINIPDHNSILWKHYKEKLSIIEIYEIFDKKDELDLESLPISDNPNIYKCEINEGRFGLDSERDNERYKALITLHDDYLEIKKGSYWRNKDRGSKEILYSKITTVDLDIGTFKLNAIEITVSGSDIITLLGGTNTEITTFYNHLKETIREYNLNKEKETVTPNIINNNQISDADELMKWHQMMEQGIITEEEFEHKKKEILGL